MPPNEIGRGRRQRGSIRGRVADRRGHPDCILPDTIGRLADDLVDRAAVLIGDQIDTVGRLADDLVDRAAELTSDLAQSVG